mmetsp:Transcript_33904/g.101077  ORF Transcript_33904/g.101077 Transcript_33904/m.101077 type:complete len:503 (+) Transcript_33904:617-2125(+)
MDEGVVHREAHVPQRARRQEGERRRLWRLRHEPRGRAGQGRAHRGLDPRGGRVLRHHTPCCVPQRHLAEAVREAGHALASWTAARRAARPAEEAWQGLAPAHRARRRRHDGQRGKVLLRERRRERNACVRERRLRDDNVVAQRLDPLRPLAQRAAAAGAAAVRPVLRGRRGDGRQPRRLLVRGLERHHHVALALQPHGTDVTEARVLEQLGELRVPEGRLAELRVELGAEDALDVGEGDGTLPRSEAPEDLLQAGAHGVPGGEQALALGGRRARPLVLGAALLHHGLRALVGDHGAVQVPEELLLRDGELHDVADLAKRPAREEGQSPHSQHLCAEVAPPRQNHAGIVQALKVGRRCAPEFCRVDVLRAVDVDEGLRASAEECGPVAPLLVLDGEPRAGLAMRAQQLDVDVNGLRPRCHSPLVEPLAEDSAVGPELVRIQRLQCRGDLGHVEGVWLPRAGRPAQCRGGLCARRHGDGTDQRRCLHDGSSRHRPRGCAWSQRP